MIRKLLFLIVGLPALAWVVFLVRAAFFFTPWKRP